MFQIHIMIARSIMSIKKNLLPMKISSTKLILYTKIESNSNNAKLYKQIFKK